METYHEIGDCQMHQHVVDSRRRVAASSQNQHQYGEITDGRKHHQYTIDYDREYVSLVESHIDGQLDVGGIFAGCLGPIQQIAMVLNFPVDFHSSIYFESPLLTRIRIATYIHPTTIWNLKGSQISFIKVFDK